MFTLFPVLHHPLGPSLTPVLYLEVHCSHLCVPPASDLLKDKHFLLHFHTPVYGAVLGRKYPCNKYLLNERIGQGISG